MSPAFLDNNICVLIHYNVLTIDDSNVMCVFVVGKSWKDRYLKHVQGYLDLNIHCSVWVIAQYVRSLYINS